MKWLLASLLVLPLVATELPADEPKKSDDRLPKSGTVAVDESRGEIILCATVQHPKGKPCIDDWGERIQAFVGCSKAAGGEAKMAGYFVFLVDVPTEVVYDRGVVARFALEDV
jgi:hypothetical protein